MLWWKKKEKAIKALAIEPPPPRPDRDGMAIAVCVKNEQTYIEEWLRYHLAVGVIHFIVYDNGSTDATCEILNRVAPPGTLTLIPWSGKVNSAKSGQLIDGQVLAFAHAILSFGSRFRRMAFIDADEFLLPRIGSTIEEALSATGDFPNVSLPWHMFGTSGHKAKPKGPVLLNYTRRSADPMSRKENVSNFKCIVDPCEVVEVSIHQFKTRSFGDLTSNDAGYRTSRDGRKGREFYSNKNLQLNHYYSKSEEEMLGKLARGSNYIASAEKLSDRMRATLRNIEEQEVEDVAMVEFVLSNAISLDNGSTSSTRDARAEAEAS